MIRRIVNAITLMWTLSDVTAIKIAPGVYRITDLGPQTQYFLNMIGDIEQESSDV